VSWSVHIEGKSCRSIALATEKGWSRAKEEGLTAAVRFQKRSAPDRAETAPGEGEKGPAPRAQRESPAPAQRRRRPKT